MTNGYSIAGTQEKFVECYKYFTKTVEQCEEMGPKETEELNKYLREYPNPEELITILYKMYNLKEGIKSDQIDIKEMEAKLVE